MMNTEQFCEFLKKQDIVKRNLAKHYQVGTTTAYPISIWQNEIVLKWNSNREPKKWIADMVEESEGVVSKGIFVRNDGTCPNEIKFYLSDGMFAYAQQVEVGGATLLPYEVATKLPRQILGINFPWWLKDCFPNSFHYIGLVDTVGQIGGCNITFANGVRPALKITTKLKVGIQFKKGDYVFTVVTSKYALCNDIIGRSMFGAFERQAVYKNSIIKEVVDNWFLTIKDEPVILFNK